MGEHSSIRGVGAAVLLVMLTACSADSGLFSKTANPDAKRSSGLNLFAANQSKSRAVEPGDLLGPDGHCAGEGAPSSALNFQAGPDASPAGRPSTAPAETQGPPQTARGLGLGMTECEVERVAGYTDKVDLSNDEHGQRRVVLTYLQGEHAGIYRFEAGRLKSIERTPDAPLGPPIKPPRKTAKKPAEKN
jgi:hypothetical protein